MTSKLRLTLPILATITTLSFFGISQAANVCNIENGPPIIDVELRYSLGGFRCDINFIYPDRQELTLDYSWDFTGTNLDESLFDGKEVVPPETFFFIENASIRCKATVTNSDQQSTKVTSNKLSANDFFKRVFGTMGEVAGNFGGVSVADEICQEEAEFYGAAGQYKAWISDDDDSPATSFTKWQLPYINALGRVFADEFGHITGESTRLGFPQLTGGNPAQVLDPIYLNTTIYPDGFTNDYIWTGTFWDGHNFGYEEDEHGDPLLVKMENCDNWVGNGEAHVGEVLNFRHFSWTYDYYQKKSCNDVAALVCIEQ